MPGWLTKVADEFAEPARAWLGHRFIANEDVTAINTRFDRYIENARVLSKNKNYVEFDPNWS